MIASLSMYDWPQAAPVNDRLWALIRDRLRAGGLDAPEALTRDRSLWDIWQSPDLLLAQTCGMPYRTRLHGQVTLVGTPDYGLEGAPPGHYYSVIVSRADDLAQHKPDPDRFSGFADRTLAFNGQDSQSGWAAIQNHAAAHGFRFAHTLHTTAHRESARAVADGRADIAAIDAVTWRLFCAHLPGEAAGLHVIGHTTPTPGLPLITATRRDPAPLRDAVLAALAALTLAERTALGGPATLIAIPPAAYLAVPTPPPPSQDAPAV